MRAKGIGDGDGVLRAQLPPSEVDDDLHKQYVGLLLFD